MPHLLALDQGTTSSRAIVFDEAGRIVSTAQKEFRQIYPQAGWVEHDPLEIWATQRGVAAEALERARLQARDMAAIGITNQRETVVLWDRRTGEPVANAIVWQDRRTAPFCDELKASGAEEEIRRRTGLLADPYFSGTKLRWLLDHVEGARARAARGELAFGTVDAWLLWNLTGGRVHATDPGNASRTMLYNIHTGCWDAELLRLLDVPAEVLPEVRPSCGIFGETQAELLGAPVPVGGVAGDQQAALFGQACFEAGLAKNTYGTGCFLLMQTGAEAVASRHRLLTTVAWQADGRLEYALEGSVFIGGAVVQWLRDGLGLIRSSEEVEALAGSVGDSHGVYFVPAFTGLGAPHWDAYARGAIVGLTRGATAAHVARAALESIAFQVADVVSAMEADSGLHVNELRVDGGASRNGLLLQFQADLLGVPVVRAAVTETTALGAAYLAGLAAGVYATRDQLRLQWKADARFEPRMSRDEAQARRRQWARAVERARGWEAQG
ncbi:MAG: glycerol kinase GlpK [Bryobacteraceae bacterium]|nr:glycerol kinase GlpK [Bryobacteraceae bacterium]